MIESSTLLVWQASLVQGDRLHLHRSEQKELVEEVLLLRAQADGFAKQMKEKEDIWHLRERAWMVQVRDVQKAGLIQMGRGEKSNGLGIALDSIVPPVSPPHGEMLPYPDNYDPMLCDWSRCDKIALFVRYDMQLDAWLPTCEACAKTGA